MFERLGSCTRSELELSKGCRDRLLQQLDAGHLTSGLTYAYLLIGLPFELIQIAVAVLSWQLANQLIELNEQNLTKDRLTLTDHP